MKIAVIGSGIAGLSCAYRLVQVGHNVTLFEANDYFGGHTNTVDVNLDGITYGVDTGFLVFNHRTYPNLVRLFSELGIETVATDMSFSVKLPRDSGSSSRILEWSGSNINTVFCQRRNLIDFTFLSMLRDIIRFNQQATALATDASNAAWQQSLGSFLDNHCYSSTFRNWYLLPMAGCIWSCPPKQMLEFPVATFIRFCYNHGLLQIHNRLQWHTVKGGARHYVGKMLAAIEHKYKNTPVRSIERTVLNDRTQIKIDSALGLQLYDHVVMASHSDQSLLMLKDSTETEQQFLSPIRYQANRAVLHTDSKVLPTDRKAWAAWNYQSRTGIEARVCVHYLINQLQPLPFKTPVIVSLNPIDEPAEDCTIQTFDYAHPVFDTKAIQAQRLLPQLQGKHNTWFAGAWTGYGFHEDGLKSGLSVAHAIAELEPIAGPDELVAA